MKSLHIAILTIITCLILMIAYKICPIDFHRDREPITTTEQDYTDADTGITFKYPSGWKARYENGYIQLSRSDWDDIRPKREPVGYEPYWEPMITIEIVEALQEAQGSSREGPVQINGQSIHIVSGYDHFNNLDSIVATACSSGKTGCAIVKASLQPVFPKSSEADRIRAFISIISNLKINIGH